MTMLQERPRTDGLHQGFIALYLDEDVDARLATTLCHRGFVVHTTQEAGKVGVTGAQQLLYACRRGLTLFTHNRAGFEALCTRYSRAREHHGGIIIVRHRPVTALVRRVLELLDWVSVREIADKTMYI